MKIKDILVEYTAQAERKPDFEKHLTRYHNPGIDKELTKQGYKRLGSGVDQTAFLAPDGTVLKIFKTNNKLGPGKFSNSQKMCMEWINYCQKNSSNPFLPKFGGFESFEFPQGSNQLYLQIRMEQLGKFPMKWHHELAEMAGAVSGGTTLKEYLDGRLPKDYYHDPRTATLAIHLGMDGLKAFWKTMEQLHKICEARNWGWDLHSGNFMIRNDGTPIIVDPYFLGFTNSKV